MESAHSAFPKMAAIVENIIGPVVVSTIILLPLLIYAIGTLMCNSIIFLGHRVQISPFAIALSASLNYRRMNLKRIDYFDFLDDPSVTITRPAAFSPVRPIMKQSDLIPAVM
jgi:hypothetical protein